ncbi:uncharacterized protein si:ch211-132g1.6 isoform X1 [Puntigrus tetrazona]|uniref:uncharacterized protein si:ch211-132g1.6 isoform X1 n=1 Tax=Puntigrus tetrazona TaxID=1606681 RepID=UPI001C892F75|nr:uncharacterized protein si:ch211-132g1.6 isoform X1 [Puntigrus tetrazona]
MSCKRTLLFLFLCGFAALSVSVKCTPELLEGTSCTIDLASKNIDKSKEIKWVHLSSELVIHRRNGKIRTNTLSGTNIEDNGSLTFQSVSLNNTGKYKYSLYAIDGTETSGEEEIQVFAKAPKPTVRIDCKDGLKLICDAGNRTDLSVSWYKEAKSMNIGELSLKSGQVEANKPYSCRVSNTVSNEESNSVTPSCKDAGTGAPGEALFPSTLFGFDFWIMVSILAGGGALLLLLICVLIICACRSCRRREKHTRDEEEMRLRIHTKPEPKNGEQQLTTDDNLSVHAFQTACFSQSS